VIILGKVDELRQQSVQCIERGDRSFVLIRQQDEFYLLDNLCPHKAAALCDGDVRGDAIECPWHKARFDVKTGAGLTPLAGKGVQSWPLSIAGDQLLAEID
jgi:nitrite reductase/ring-hydroxylating ferredoxin subunit